MSGGNKGKNRQDGDELPLSRPLRQLLVNDASAIASGRLHAVPATPTVSHIIAQYRNEKGTLSEEEDAILNDLLVLFDAMIGHSLCYKEERLQYAEMTATGKSARDYFGAWHLLRLLATLPVMKTDSLKNVSLDLLAFLERHHTFLFPSHG